MAILEQIKAAGLREYGVYPEDMAAKLAQHAGAEALVAALNNADVDGAALALLETTPEKVFQGMALTAQALGTQKKVLHIPEYGKNLMESLAELAKREGVELVLGIVDVRARANACICHIVTMAEIADLWNGCYRQGVYLSVNGGAFSKVPGDRKLKELVGQQVKGVRTGYTVRDQKALELTVAQANIENGVLQGLTGDDCVVDLTQKQLHACRSLSCGKCVFCREGLIQLESMQKDMTLGKGRMEMLDMTQEIGEAMTFSTPCSMGQNASRMALSAVAGFRGEYEAHIKKHKCVADVCTAFRKVYVDPLACTGCAVCQASCPRGAIDGSQGYIHVIFDNWCEKCGKCIEACPENAIHLTTGAVPKLPGKMMRVGRFRG